MKACLSSVHDDRSCVTELEVKMVQYQITMYLLQTLVGHSYGTEHIAL
jgi:hypothetical protein